MFLTAMKDLRKAIEQKDDLTQYILNAQTAAVNTSQRNELVDTLIMAQQFQQAEIIAREVLAADPENGTAQYYMGRISVALNRVEESQKWLSKALKNGYVNERSLMIAALTEKALGNNRQMEQLLKQAAEQPHSNPLPYLLLYSEYMERGFYREALQIAQKLGESFPETYMGYHIQINTMFQAKDYIGAKKKLESLCGRFGNMADYVYDYTIALYLNNEIDCAQKFFSENEDVLDKDSLIYLRLAAQLAAAQQDKDAAMLAYKKLFEKYHLNNAAMSLAVFLIDERKFGEADHYLQEVIKGIRRDKAYFSALYLHAFCLEQLQDTATQDAYRNAVQIYEAAYQKNAYNVYCMTYAAQCYSCLGDQENAKRCEAVVEAEKKRLGFW